MLLSRTAENVFWIGRYVERAENMARLLDAGRRMSAIPGQREHQSEWEPILSAAGCKAQFDRLYDSINQQNVVEFLAFSRENQSSIVSCIRKARDNARSVRTAMTLEMWESLNSFWLELKHRHTLSAGDGRLATYLDQIKQRCALFSGITNSTSLHNDTYNFLRLGHHIERADCTARILDVKYFALLAPSEEIAGGMDLYQWSVILRAAGVYRAYHWVYSGDLEAGHVADFLILNVDCARSLAHCVRETNQHLIRLARLYAAHHRSHELVEALHQEVSEGDINDIIASGLHEFVTAFIRKNNALATQIAHDYYFPSRSGSSLADTRTRELAAFGSRRQNTA